MGEVDWGGEWGDIDEDGYYRTPNWETNGHLEDCICWKCEGR